MASTEESEAKRRRQFMDEVEKPSYLDQITDSRLSPSTRFLATDHELFARRQRNHSYRGCY